MAALPKRLGGLVRAAAVLAFFLAAAVAYTWPLARDLDGTYVHPPGMAGSLAQADSLLTSWIVSWGAHALRTRPAEVFDANVLYPLEGTLAFSEHLLAGAALVLPVDALAANPVRNNNVLLLATFVIGGAGTAWLARELGAASVPALAAGVFAFFGPLRLAQIGHVHALSLHWLPVALALLHRTWRTASTPAALALAAALSLQALASVYLAYYSALAVLVLAGTLRALGWRGAPGGLGRVSAAGLCAALVAAPVMVPYARAVEVFGLARDPGEAFLFAARGVTYLGAFLDPVLHLRQRFVEDGWPVAVVGVGLAGLAAIGLVAGAAGTRGGRRTAAAYAVTAIVMALVSLGPAMQLRPSLEPGVPGPHLLLARVLPGFEALRVPHRAAGIVVLALAVLSALGAEALLARLRPGGRSFAAAALGGLLIFESWHPRLATTSAADAVPEPSWQRWLAERPGREPVVELPFGVVEHDAAAMVRRARDWRPLVNGYTGFLPAGYYLRTVLASFPDERSIGLLAGLGVRWVLVDGFAYARGGAPLPCAAPGTPGLRAAHRADDGCVLEVVAAAPPEPVRDDRSVPPVRLVGSDGVEPALDAAGRLRSAWSQPVVRAEEGWLEMELPATHALSRIVLRLGRHFGWYLRQYRVDVSEDGERWTAVRDVRVGEAPLVRYRTHPVDLETTIDVPPVRARWVRVVRPAARAGDPPDLWLGWSRWGTEGVELRVRSDDADAGAGAR